MTDLAPMSVYLPKSDHARLGDIAHRLRIGRAVLLRQIVQAYLAGQSDNLPKASEPTYRMDAAGGSNGGWFLYRDGLPIGWFREKADAIAEALLDKLREQEKAAK